VAYEKSAGASSCPVWRQHRGCRRETERR
jgi:hypothetical protein